MSDHAPPARPHLRFTADGRRRREILSYSRRGSRLTPTQQESWDAYAARWVIPEAAVDEPGFDLIEQFGRAAPLIIEIGSGVGEATVELARHRPDHIIVALEVWRPGIAHTLGLMAEAGVENVRLVAIDAVWALQHLVAADGLAELWTFFPDPWPKKRHHKRRLVTASFAALVADRLRPGAWWRLATDWAPYAEQMRSVLDAEPRLEGGEVERWAERPVTKFERKGIAAGRTITDLAYRRVT